MPIGYPFFLQRRAVYGLGIPTMGMAWGHGVSDAVGDGFLVDMEEGKPYPLQDDSRAVQIYLDGVYVGESEQGSRMDVINGLREGENHQSDLLPLSWIQHAHNNGAGSTIFSGRVRGNRVCIQWTDQPTDEDFSAYVIHWDQGLGGGFSELAVVYDLDILEWRSAELSAGTYKFKLAYRDIIGNESALGAEISVTVPSRALAVENLQVSYSQANREVTLSWTNPSQPSDVRRLVIFDNAMPGFSYLAPHANSQMATRRDTVAATDTSWTSENLWQGVDRNGNIRPWRFAVRALLCDTLGSELGPAAEASIVLFEDGMGNLTDEGEAVAAPRLLRLEPVAAGKYKATFEIDSETGLTEFKIVQDGVEVDTVALAGSVVYEYTSGALTHGQSYAVSIRAYQSTDGYTQSNAFDVVVDDTAPSGDGVITGALCI